MSQPAPASSELSRFSTDAFAPRDRVAAWCDLFGSTIAKLELEPASDSELKADATLRNLPGLGLVMMTSAELHFRKTPSLISNDDLILTVIDSGGWSGSQLGRETHLRSGEAVVCTNSEIAEGKSFGRRMMLRVALKAIAPLVGDVSAGILRRIPANNDALRLLRPYIGMMQNAAATDLERIAANHMHDLFALLLGSAREVAEVARGHGVRAARLKAIKGDIATRLADTGLSVTEIAGRHKLSPRYLHRLFEEDGVTFSEYVMGLRLTCAQRMLADARYAALSISTIGYDAGFGDPSYFFRSFRRRFGMTPSDMRAQRYCVN